MPRNHCAMNRAQTPEIIPQANTRTIVQYDVCFQIKWDRRRYRCAKARNLNCGVTKTLDLFCRSSEVMNGYYSVETVHITFATISCHPSLSEPQRKFLKTHMRRAARLQLSAGRGHPEGVRDGRGPGEGARVDDRRGRLGGGRELEFRDFPDFESEGPHDSRQFELYALR